MSLNLVPLSSPWQLKLPYVDLVRNAEGEYIWVEFCEFAASTFEFDKFPSLAGHVFCVCRWQRLDILESAPECSRNFTS
jgi:hypothetical protein